MIVIKGQISTELIVIIAAIMIVFIPLLVTVYITTGNTENTIATQQGQLAAARIANMINTVGNLGEGSFTTLEVYLPRNTKSIRFENAGRGSEVTITVITQDGPVDLPESARFPLDYDANEFDSVGEGRIRLELRSDEGKIALRRKR